MNSAILSYGMGVESTAILVRWICEVPAKNVLQVSPGFAVLEKHQERYTGTRDGMSEITFFR